LFQRPPGRRRTPIRGLKTPAAPCAARSASSR
jgi:hypothetical protein